MPSRPLVALLCAVAALVPLSPAHAFVYAGNPELVLTGDGPSLVVTVE